MQQASTTTRESAVDLIHQYQKRKAHPMLRAEFSIVVEEEELIPYPSQKGPPKRESGIG